jgi:hypothetical protein
LTDLAQRRARQNLHNDPRIGIATEFAIWAGVQPDAERDHSSMRRYSRENIASSKSGFSP